MYVRRNIDSLQRVPIVIACRLSKYIISRSDSRVIGAKEFIFEPQAPAAIGLGFDQKTTDG